jgi:epsilon-lactone hydrolase
VSNVVTSEHNARKAGVDVHAEVFPDRPRAFRMATGYAPESGDAIQKPAARVRPMLGPA